MPKSNQPRHFDIEGLSPEEYLAEHSRLKASMGDSAYLALRKSEINTRMADITAAIMAGRISLPPIERVQEPNRISFEGREFRVGASEGVPKDISDAMLDFASKNVDEGDQVEVPEEWLKYEIEASEDESKDDLEANQKRQNQEILDGKFSVRNVKMPGEGKALA
jgi:hypothetical protein